MNEIRTGDYHGLFDYSPIIDRPPLRWPNDARIAVWVITNIEHYDVQAPSGKLDVRWVSQTDYGNRVGLWRIMKVLDDYEVRGAVTLNAAVCRLYPRIVEECLRRDWELLGHGLTNSQHLVDLAPEAEREVITRTLSTIRSFSGQAVRGWLGPGLGETAATLDLLREAGVEYVCDWANDDQPYRLTNGLYSIPYSMQWNDFSLLHHGGYDTNQFAEALIEAFDVLYDEGAEHGRVLSIPIHPFFVGMPHRIRALQRALSHIRERDDVWFATGQQIVDWYRSVEAK